MEKSLLFISGMVLVLAMGFAYADELQPGDGYTSDKMIRNDDLQKYDYEHDQGSGTFNQLPVVPEAQGSAGGGTSGEDNYEKTAPLEQDRTAPSESGGAGIPSKGLDTYRY